jgi:hypothetical protein
MRGPMHSAAGPQDSLHLKFRWRVHGKKTQFISKEDKYNKEAILSRRSDFVSEKRKE